MSSNDSDGATPGDRSIARKFLQSLGRGEFTFQTFDDNAARRNRSLARILHGTIDQHFTQLQNLNRNGAGIFVTINRTDGKGRGRDNIIGIRALFVDLDGAPLIPVMQWRLPPHIVVESSPDRYHAYWLVDGTVALTAFTELQRKLAKLFGGDPKVHDLPRVLRLPGFIHQKGEPFCTRQVHDNVKMPPYSDRDLRIALAHISVTNAEPPQRSQTPAIEPDRPGNVSAAIAYLKYDADPAVQYEQGNNRTYATACYVRGHFGLSKATCCDVMEEHFNPRCDPPWAADELEAIVTHVYAYAQSTQGAESAEAEFAADPLPPSPNTESHPAPRPRQPDRRLSRQRALRRRRAWEFMS